ncbi:MAG TPA: DUF2085 domain-containing protein [Anaerolineales bacterium]|nr:DUF2085 domain-containing protein [Anaerolineales bacterium]
MSNVTVPARPAVSRSYGDWLASHWFQVFLIIYGLWVWLPFLAPVFMNLGWTGGGKAIYFIYSFFCHQLPERSFFFFGQKTMYSLREIQAAWQNTDNPMILRQFIGNEAIGWKVAWSDRMISFYTSVWLFAVIWWPLRRKVKPLSWWAFALLLLPIIIDGGTHAISDLAGIGQGFRDTNQWLAVLTNNSLPVTFYVGDALGSVNSWARLLTGILAGLGIGWLAFPYVFQSQALNQQLDQLNYGAVLEQIKNQNPRSSG